MVRTSLRQEIFIRIGGEVRCCAGLAAEGFVVTDLLQVVQPTGDALVALGLGNHSFYFYILPLNDADAEKTQIMDRVMNGGGRP